MNQYLAGTAVHLPINLTDEDGNPLQVTSATYRILNQSGNELLASTDFNISASTLVIASEINSLVPPDINALNADPELRYSLTLNEVREVEFDVTLQDGNVIGLSESYILYPRDSLLVGFNSFQSLSEATLTANLIYDNEVFVTASRAKRIAGLTEAYSRISKLNFRDLRVGDSYLNGGTTVNLSEISPIQYEALSSRFKSALRKAQVIEANVVLGGGDPIEQMRQNGLLSQTIGETQETYRGTPPAVSLVAKATLRELSEYINNSLKITRV